jgi:hypothetical protein
MGTGYIDWAQISRFYRRTETDSSTRNVGFLNENRKMGNAQKHICNNIPVHINVKLLNTLTECGILKWQLALWTAITSDKTFRLISNSYIY